MALTAAFEKGAEVVVELILIARLTVAENMQTCEYVINRFYVRYVFIDVEKKQ